MCFDLTQIGMPCLVNTFLKGKEGGVGIWERDRKQQEGAECRNFVLGQCGREWLPGYQQREEISQLLL